MPGPFDDIAADALSGGIELTGTTGRSARNNNPLNLEFRQGSYQDQFGAQMEETPKSGRARFAKFPTMQAGYQAGLEQVRTDQGRSLEYLENKYPDIYNRYGEQMRAAGGHTLASFVEKFAPRHENPTDQLISSYAKQLGVSPNTPLSKIPADKLIVPMLARESSTRIAGGLGEKIAGLLGPSSAEAAEPPPKDDPFGDIAKAATSLKFNKDTAKDDPFGDIAADAKRSSGGVLNDITGRMSAATKPSTQMGEMEIGRRLGMVDIATTAARAIDPASAMTGAGIFPAADDPVWNAPQGRDARAQVANKVMTQALFPEGVPAEKTGAVDWVARDLARMWPQIIELMALGGYGAPAEMLSGITAMMVKGAVPFALAGTMEQSPVSGVAKGAALGGTLGAMHSLTGHINNTLAKWVSRIAGGASIGGGSAYLEGGSAEEIKKNAVLFSLFELMGMPRDERPVAAEKVPENVKNELLQFAERAENVIAGYEDRSYPSAVAQGTVAETVGKGKRARTVEKAAPVEMFPEEDKLTPAPMELITKAAGRERQLEIDKSPMQWSREKGRWLDEERPGIEEAKQDFAKEVGVDPSKVSYRGIWEFGDGVTPDHFMFRIDDPNYAGGPSDGVWPVGPETVRSDITFQTDRYNDTLKKKGLEAAERELSNWLNKIEFRGSGPFKVEAEKQRLADKVRGKNWFSSLWDNLKSSSPGNKDRTYAFKGLYEDLKRKWAPETRTPEAMETAQDFTRYMTEAKAEVVRAAKTFDEYTTKFSEMGSEEAYKLSSKMERGEQVPPEWEPYAKARKEVFDRTHRIITRDIGKPLGYIDNYAVHLYKDPEGAGNILRNLIGRRPLEGGRKFFKQRLIPDMDTAKAHGLEPRFDNPAIQDLAGLMEQWRFIGANNFIDSLQKSNLFIPEAYGRPAKPVPNGYVRTDPRIIRQGWMPREALDVLNNHLINDGSNLWYSKYRNLTAAWNAFHVAASLFHGVATTAHEMSMGFAQNIPEFIGAVLAGDYTKASTALKGMGPLRPVQTFKKGIQGFDAFYNPGKHGPDVQNLVDLATKGGHIPGGHSPLHDVSAKSFTEFANQLKGGEIGRAFRSMINWAGKPLMEYFVPRMKYGSTLVRLEKEIERITDKYNKKYGEKWTPEVEASYNKDLLNASYNERQFSDNVFGIVDPDNMHWSRGMAKGLKAVIAYPYWNVGTFRWMAGIARGLGQTLTGQELDYQSRRSLQFALGLAVTTGIANTIMHMAMNNGQAPDDWQDVLIGARTGRYLSNGAPERITIASYMKDLIPVSLNVQKLATGDIPGAIKGAGRTIESKLMFPFKMIQELYANTDYYGKEIMPTKSGVLGQLGGAASYVAEQAAPFGFSNLKRGKSDLAKYGGFVGLRTVGREYTSSEAQNRIDQIIRAQAPRQRTQESSDTGQLIADLKDKGWSGQRAEMEQGIQEARRAGKLTDIQAKHIRQDILLDKRVAQFKKLRQMEDALEVYELGTPEERRLWRMDLAQKWSRSTPAKRRMLKEEYQKAIALPVVEKMPERIPPRPQQAENTPKKEFSILNE